jgi:hypothetical protein
MIMTRETEVLGEKFVPLPLCPPQLTDGLTRFHTLSFPVRGYLECSLSFNGRATHRHQNRESCHG